MKFALTVINILLDIFNYLKMDFLNGNYPGCQYYPISHHIKAGGGEVVMSNTAKEFVINQDNTTKHLIIMGGP